MDDFHSSVMIALLPTTSEWCNIDLPHMTLVFVGDIADLSPTTHNELAKAALSLAMTCHALTLDVIGTDVFGDEEKVEVLLLNPTPELLAMRHIVEFWNASQHKTFTPHVTVGPIGSTGSAFPLTLTFDRILVAWGNSNLTYRLLFG